MQAAALGDDGVQTVRYWLYAPGEGACMWEEFYARGIMGLAWGEIGDLSAYAHKEDLKAQRGCQSVCVRGLIYKYAVNLSG